jgi:hypothetical protein
MAFTVSAKILTYSESKSTGKRIATFVLTIPKFIQAHINSHRSLSRNASSSRAMPAKIIRKRVLENPFIPIEFGKNKPGMRGGEAVTGFSLWFARISWLWARYIPCCFHWVCEKLNIHKEVINRLIEPWMFTEVVVTATEWQNFIKLRGDNAAQPEIQVIAKDIERLLRDSKPTILEVGEWHLPFITEQEKNDFKIEDLLKISVARCARVSYRLYDGTFSNLEKDVLLCNKLIEQGHWSPFEHVATPINSMDRSGNFVGWSQYRKHFENENGGDYEEIK